MSITKSIILAALLYLTTRALDFVVLLFNWNFPAYEHILGLSGILSYLFAFLFFIFYFRMTKPPVSFPKGSITTSPQILIPTLIILAIGDHLVDLPFFHWKDLSNTYFGTKWQIPDYSNYKFSTLQRYRAFSALIFAPVLEEMFFRYYLFGGLLKRYKFSTALITSSILFALIHVNSLYSLRNFFPALIFGVISCIIYFRTRTIVNSIILHFLANAIWFMTVVFAGYNELMKLIGSGVIFWIVVLTGVLLLWIGVRKIATANTRFAASLHPTGLANK